jgi:hypothetical protein
MSQKYFAGIREPEEEKIKDKSIKIKVRKIP